MINTSKVDSVKPMISEKPDGIKSVQSDRNWFNRAAAIWADMERGIYPWEKPKRKKADGTYPVVKAQILKDLGISTDYHDQKRRIWENPYFLKALALENRRRDTGLSLAVAEIEKVVGPLHETRERVITHVKGVFDRPPDAEDPLALSPKDYVSEAMKWIRYIDETEGRTEADKSATIESIIADAAATNKVNAEMVASAMQLLEQRHQEQRRNLHNLGVIDCEAIEE